jgi:succinate dehydrogenase / fumarate reductase flavoprotein subunit
MWDNVGMSRNENDLKTAITEIKKLREEYWKDINVAGSGENMNKNLEFAGRLADYMELGELMAIDALNRPESCGGHFREESQTEEGEAKRDDENYAFVAAWEFKGVDNEPVMHKEELTFVDVPLTQRSYK